MGLRAALREHIGWLWLGQGKPASVGNLNLNEGGADQNAGSALLAMAQEVAERGGGTVRVLPGVYYFDTSITIPYDNIEIALTAGAELRTKNNTSAVGLITFSGDNCALTGPGTIRVESGQWANDQVLILATGDDFCFDGPRFIVEDSSGSGDNPMTLLKGSSAERMLVRRMKSHPNAGVRCVQFLNCTNPELSDFYAGPIAGTTARLCWRVVDIDGGSQVNLRDVRISYLGTTAAPLNDTIRTYENDFEAGGQEGDRYRGIDIANVACRRFFHALGRKSWVLSDSRFRGANTSVLNRQDWVSRFDAAVLVDSVNGDGLSPMDNQYAAHIVIDNCQFDGACGGNASDILIRSCAKGEIKGIRSFHFGGASSVVIDGDHCIDIQVSGPCYFDGQHSSTYTQQYVPVRVINRLTAPTTTTISSGDVGTLSFGNNNGVITAATGDFREYVEVGNYIRIASADESGNNIAAGAQVTAVTEFTLTVSGVSFTLDASDTNAVITVVPEVVDSGQNGVAYPWEELENIVISGVFAEGYKLTRPVLSSGIGSFPPTVGARGSYFPYGMCGFETYITSTGISFTAPNQVAGTGLFTGVVVGDHVMILGADNQENNGLRIVGARTDDLLTLTNPTGENNSDPTKTSTAITGASVSMNFGAGGTITRASGSWTTDGYVAGTLLTITGAEDSANNQSDLLVQSVSGDGLTLTLAGVTFAANAADTSCTITPRNKGWTMVNESAGNTIKVFVMKRAYGELGVARPLSTNVAGRRLG